MMLDIRLGALFVMVVSITKIAAGGGLASLAGIFGGSGSGSGSTNFLNTLLSGGGALGGAGATGGGNPLEEFQKIIQNMFKGKQSPAAAQSFCETSSKRQNDQFGDEQISEACRREYWDLLFVVDGSGSVGKDNFQRIKDFLKLVVDITEVGAGKSRIGLVQFSSQPTTEFSLNTHSSNAAVKNAIDVIPYRKGGTYIGKAMRYALNNELTVARGVRSDKKTIVIVLTDGESSDEPKEAANALRARGFSTMAIGVEPQTAFSFFNFGKKTDLNNEQLLNIAGNADRVFRVCDFKKLDNDFKSALATQICTETETCKNSYSDLMLVVDGSGSIGAENFEKVKTFLKLIVDSVDVGPNKNRIGMIQFNNNPQTQFSLDENQSKDQLFRALDEVQWLRGKTNIGKAIDHARANEFKSSKGDRPNIGNVLLVLTDGKSGDNVAQAARLMREDGVTTFALGISDEVDKNQLRQIAGDTSREFIVNDFESLNRRLKNAITSKICGEPKITIAPVTTNLPPGTEPGYLGCYQDTWQRIMPLYAGWEPTLTPKSCLTKCKARNKPLAGLQLTHACFCGTKAELAKAKKLPDSACSAHCSGDRNLKCGQNLISSVYEEYVVTTPAPTTTTERTTPAPRGGGVEGGRRGRGGGRRGGRITPAPSVGGGRARGGGKECDADPLDLIFVLDGSSSIKADNFETIKSFIKGIVSSATIGQDETQVAVVQFNDSPLTEITLDDYHNKEDLLDAIDQIEWLQGETQVGKALAHVKSDILSESRGWRRNRDSQTVVLTITDGKSSDNPLRPAKKLRKAKATTVAIGITKSVDKRQLRNIAGNKKRVHLVTDFTDLNPVLHDKLSDTVCGIGPLGPIELGGGEAEFKVGKGKACKMNLVIGVDSDLQTKSFYSTVNSAMKKFKHQKTQFAIFRTDEFEDSIAVLHAFGSPQALSRVRRTLKGYETARETSDWDELRETLLDNVDNTHTAILYLVGDAEMSEDVVDELEELDQLGIPVVVAKFTTSELTSYQREQFNRITGDNLSVLLEPSSSELVESIGCPS